MGTAGSARQDKIIPSLSALHGPLRQRRAIRGPAPAWAQPAMPAQSVIQSPRPPKLQAAKSPRGELELSKVCYCRDKNLLSAWPSHVCRDACILSGCLPWMKNTYSISIEHLPSPISRDTQTGTEHLSSFGYGK